MGAAQHLIVTVEQLFKSSAGHLCRLGTLIREHQDFQRRIIHINVDEAHSIHIASTLLHALSAFCPALGKLDELKAPLPNHICWNAFSVTLPLHFMKTVTKHGNIRQICHGFQSLFIHVQLTMKQRELNYQL